MAKARGRHTDIESRCEDVLVGRFQPTAGDLMELIHEVNPTSRALPGRVEARRYERDAAGKWVRHSDEQPRALLRVWSADLAPRERLLVEADTGSRRTLCVSHEVGLVYVLRSGVLIALQPAPDGLEERWRVPVSGYCELLTDEQARRVVLERRTTRLELVPLGRDAPALEAGERKSSPHERWPLVYAPLHCGDLSAPYNHKAENALHSMGPWERKSWLDGLRKGRASVEYLLTTAARLENLERFSETKERQEEARRLVRIALELHPDDPAARLAEAHVCALDGNWTQVSELLEDVASAALPTQRRDHHLHLLALALLRAGRIADAARLLDDWLLERTGEEEDRCGLISLSDHLQVLLKPLQKLSWQDQPTQPTRVAALLRHVDALLEAKSIEEARGLLDEEIVKEAGELQSSARVAYVRLALPIAEAEQFSCALQLARFSIFSRRTGFRMRSASGDTVFTSA